MESTANPDKNFILKWILATMIGVTIGWIMGILVHTSLILGLIKHVAVFGGIVGVSQWFVLRRYLSQAGWWVLMNTVGWPLGFALGISLISSWGWQLNVFLFGIIAGAVVGGLGWFILLQPSSRIMQWTLANTIGWGVGFMFSDILAYPFIDRFDVTPGMFLGLILTGATAGTVTGIILARLLQPSVSATTSKAATRRQWVIGLCCLLFGLLAIVFVLDHQAEKQGQVNGLQFNEFDKANRIEVHRYEASPVPPLIIENPEKIKFAQEFIKRYPDGWQRPRFSARIEARINIIFFNGPERLGGYGVGLDFLTYNSTYARRFEDEEERRILFEMLGIEAE
jgi:hypothetical protein